jgi:hypothetical protein
MRALLKAKKKLRLRFGAFQGGDERPLIPKAIIPQNPL